MNITIMMCQHKINCNKCTTQVGEADNGRDHACVWVRCTWEIYVPSAQFCCALKLL